ncbi:hypothetical protein Tco_0548013, partial [Tanacetum coccineum]
MEQYLAWGQNDIRTGVVKPNIDNDVEFEINSNFMRELRRKLFKSTDDKDAHEHVRRVLKITDLFHFPRSISTWDLLEKAFIRQYYPPFKTAKKLEEIRNFKQEVKVVQLTHTVLTNISERIKAKMKLGKNNMKEHVPHDLPVDYPYAQPTPILECLKGQKGNHYKTRETVCMIGISEETHEEKTQINNGFNITVEDVERLRVLCTTYDWVLCPSYLHAAVKSLQAVETLHGNPLAFYSQHSILHTCLLLVREKTWILALEEIFSFPCELRASP